MELVIARGESRRDFGAFVPWRQENMLMEATGTDPKQFNLLSRAPLVEAYSWGSGVVSGTYRKEGLFDGDLFAVVGDTLYRDGTALGAINGTGPVSWASSEDEIVLTRGADAWSYTQADGLDAITFPDGADVTAVAGAVAGRFVYARAGTDRWYFSELNDGRDIDDLNWATAESAPDGLRDLMTVGDGLFLFGAESIEPWFLTGDAALPWTRVSNASMPVGVFGTGCTVELDNTFYTVGADGVVYRREQVLRRMSEHWLEEQIRASSTVRAFKWFRDGHLVFCVKLDDATYGLDVSSGPPWFKLSTYGRNSWSPICSVVSGGQTYFGDDTSPIIWTFGEFDDGTDAGQPVMPRYFTAALPLSAQPGPIANVLVDGNNGDTPATTGANADPRLEMRASRNGGKTFTSWSATKWGAQGEYRQQARFGGQGYFDPPGALFEFRMNEVVPLRVSNVRANESLAGRGR